MGQFLAILSPSPSSHPSINVDLINPSICRAEEDLVSKLRKLELSYPKILNDLRSYTGCEDTIRLSISKPSPEHEDQAWNAVIPCVTTLRTFFDFALKFETLIPEILNFFCEPNNNVIDVRANMEKYQGSARAFAEYVSFCCQFDEIKMSIPSIQNDFSYYRRVLSRTKNAAQPITVPVPDDVANRMSLFYAYSTPMLKSLIDNVTTYVSKQNLQLPIGTCLLMLAGAFHDALPNMAPELVPFALRVMTVCLVLFDHIHPNGLFTKHSDINLRLYVKAIQTHAGTSASTLLNILKFSTKTYSLPEAAKHLKAIVEKPVA